MIIEGRRLELTGPKLDPEVSGLITKGKRSIALLPLSVASGFLLVSCILVDYVYCCTVSCARFDALTSPLWAYYFNLVNPFFQDFSRANPDMGFLSQLSAQAGLWFIVLLISFVLTRLSKNGHKVVSSLFDSFQLAVMTVFLFEIGIFFLCPTWRTAHVSNLQNGTALFFLNNEDLLFLSGIFLVLSIMKHLAISPRLVIWRRVRNSSDLAEKDNSVR